MFRKSLLLLTLCLGLAACEDPAERAERYYQSALALLEEGDRDRALLELRNVFDHDGFHLEARALYADLLVQAGDIQQGMSQYLRLVEQDPNRLDARLILADFALESGNWNEVERHANAALEIAPDQPGPRAYGLLLAYRDARLARDDIAAGVLVADAQALLETTPDLEVAQRLMIDWLATGPEPARALPYIDAVLERRPDSYGMHMTRLRVLSEANLPDEVEAQLLELYTRFPDNPTTAEQLIQWYVSLGDFDALEQFLRERAGADDGNFEDHMTVVQLLQRTEGPEAALAELTRLAEANADTDLGRRYRLMAVGLQFDSAAQEATAEALVALIEAFEDPGLRDEARIALAQIQGAQGNRDAAQAQIAEVLENDASNVQALLLRAAWRIQDQEFGQAITDLRVAQDQDPRNTEILLLLAEAHQKLGNAALAEQRLARAVEVSGSAPREALVFARFQLARGNLGTAEQVLTDSLRESGDLEVARLLGQVQLRQGDIEGVSRVIAQLNGSGNPEAEALARSLQAAILFSENRVDESLAFLRSSVDENADPESTLASDVQILRLQMMSGRLEEARTQLERLREQYPESLALRMLEGNILSLEGDNEGAIAVYREVLAENPEELIVIQQLYATLRGAGQEEAASDLLARSVEAQPEARPLQLLSAVEAERQGVYAEAISVYEDLYANNPNDVTVINNLASVLAYYTESEADLERAYQVSLPLAGINQPEFLDTLGYIQLRRGELDQAILNLQAAARGLPVNPTIAFNLALAYAEAGRIDEAREELERGFELSGEQTNIPQLERARSLARELDLAAPKDDL